MVDYEKGVIDPPPQWVSVMRRARWMGVAPWDLIDQDDCWGDWADLLMQIEAEGRERANKK